MDEARRARAKRLYRPLGWITAAAALLVLGLGIGRMTAPEGGPGPAVASGPAVAPVPNPAVLRTASLDHLVKTETLLTLVRADARAGWGAYEDGAVPTRATNLCGPTYRPPDCRTPAIRLVTEPDVVRLAASRPVAASPQTSKCWESPSAATRPRRTMS